MARNWQDLGVRSLSAVVLIPAVLIADWAGGPWFIILVALAGVMMAREYVAIVHGGSEHQFALHAAAALSGAVLPAAAGPGVTLLALGALWAVSLFATARSGKSPGVWTAIGVAYVGLPCAGLELLRMSSTHGALSIVFLFAVVWAADISAYFAGRLIGGPKLMPAISPNKTWAGLCGAIAGGICAGAALWIFDRQFNLLWLVALGAGLAVVEQGGDLIESALKRRHGVKDSGNLIPGHGGILDRIDGLIAAAVIAAGVAWAWRGLGIGAGFLLR